MVIYFTRYVHIKSIKILSLYYHELIGKIVEQKGKKYLMVDDYLLDKVSKHKEIVSIEKFDNSIIFIDTDDEFLDDKLVAFLASFSV